MINYIAPNAHYGYSVTLYDNIVVSRIASSNTITVKLPFACKVYKSNKQTYNQQSSSNPTSNVSGGGYITDLSANTTYTTSGYNLFIEKYGGEKYGTF